MQDLSLEKVYTHCSTVSTIGVPSFTFEFTQAIIIDSYIFKVMPLPICGCLVSPWDCHIVVLIRCLISKSLPLGSTVTYYSLGMLSGERRVVQNLSLQSLDEVSLRI